MDMPTNETPQPRPTPARPRRLPPPPPQRSKGRSFFWPIFGCLFVIGGLCFLGFIAIIVIFGAAAESLNTPHGKFKEVVIYSGDANERIAVISINGTIMGNGSLADPADMVHLYKTQFETAANDPTIKCVLIQMDSGGGGLTASDILYNEVKKLRDKKPVVVSIGSMAASGGYYIIAPADHIVLNPTGEVGSFGVIMPHFVVSGLMDKVGVQFDPVKSTGSKDIGSPFREMTESERAFFENILSAYHKRFVDIIAEGRGIPVAEVAKLATGEIYLADFALEQNLIDEIGYFDDALAKAISLSKATNPRVVSYQVSNPFEELFGVQAKKSDVEHMAGLLRSQLLLNQHSVQALYTGQLFQE